MDIGNSPSDLRQFNKNFAKDKDTRIGNLNDQLTELLDETKKSSGKIDLETLKKLNEIITKNQEAITELVESSAGFNLHNTLIKLYEIIDQKGGEEKETEQTLVVTIKALTSKTFAQWNTLPSDLLDKIFQYDGIAKTASSFSKANNVGGVSKAWETASAEVICQQLNEKRISLGNVFVDKKRAIEFAIASIKSL